MGFSTKTPFSAQAETEGNMPDGDVSAAEAQMRSTSRDSFELDTAATLTS